MKKVLIALVVFMCSMSAYAGEAAKTIDDKMLDRMDGATGFIENSLTQLAQKLGTTMAYLWPCLVRQQIAYGVAMIAGAVMALVAGITMCVIFQKRRSKAIEGDRYSDAADAYNVIGWVLCIIGIIVFIPVFLNGIIILAAPEAAALQDLLHAISHSR